MYSCTRRETWTSFSCLVLLKYYHVVFSQFKIPANLAQLAVPKMHCLYANTVVQPSVQHCPCYMTWKTKVHTWCRHCQFCIMHPCEEKKDGCRDFLTLPRIGLYLIITIWSLDFQRRPTKLGRVYAFFLHIKLNGSLLTCHFKHFNLIFYLILQSNVIFRTYRNLTAEFCQENLVKINV